MLITSGASEYIQALSWKNYIQWQRTRLSTKDLPSSLFYVPIPFTNLHYLPPRRAAVFSIMDQLNNGQEMEAG